MVGWMLLSVPVGGFGLRERREHGGETRSARRRKIQYRC